MKNAKNGFSLIETVVSLLMVSLGLLLIGKIIVLSFDAGKKSLYRFRLQQKHEYCRDLLLSKPFSSTELHWGSHSQPEDNFLTRWVVSDVEPGLKKIELTISYKQLTQKSILYKSKYIREVVNE